MEHQPGPRSVDRRPRAVFVGTTYAGWKTRQLNLERHVAEDGRLNAAFHRVTGWHEGGRFERLPVPAGVRGRLRAAEEARGFSSVPRPDVVWTSCLELALPYVGAMSGPLQRPLVVETDWTLDQQEALAPIYFRREPKTGARLRLAEAQERLLNSRVTLFTPISNWAADGLRRLGVEDERIRVVHPGLDLEAWAPREHEPAADRPVRLLFVGGDWERKGGPMLLDVFRATLGGRCELDIVTRDEVGELPSGVRLHRLEPNSSELRDLYQRADLFVMPTRAECWGHVTVEAMASGLPAVVGDVGGARDIVVPGETGWLVEPEPAALAMALESALADVEGLAAMGRRARRRAEERFDGHQNDRVVIDLLLDQVERWQVSWRGLRRRAG